MPELEPPAEFDALRCIWCALTRHPLPVFGGNARPVLEALAEIAATTEAARFMEGDSPLLATGYIEEQMSRIALADVVTVPEDPPG